MDQYVESVCKNLGCHKLLETGFPTTDQMIFIESIVGHKDVEIALENNLEATEKFEKEGLKGTTSAIDFFDHLVAEMSMGSYRSAAIRMDMQISTRVLEHAPDCKLNMDLKTSNWNRKLNMSMATCEKLLQELQDAKTLIRENNAEEMKEQEQ